MYILSHNLLSFAINIQLEDIKRTIYQTESELSRISQICEHNVDYILSLNSYKSFNIIPEQFRDI